MAVAQLFQAGSQANPHLRAVLHDSLVDHRLDIRGDGRRH
jgi:hypothetical protein